MAPPVSAHEVFVSPSCKNMIDFHKQVKNIPGKFKPHLDEISQDTLAKVTDADAVMILECNDDLDGLCQLMEAFFRIQAPDETDAETSTQSHWADAWGLLASGTEKKKKKSKKASTGLLIISQEKDERNAYARIVDSLKHWTDEAGHEHLEGAATSFGNVIVVKGANYDKKPNENALKEVVKRIDIAIEQIIKKTTRHSSSQAPKLIWHHGPNLSLLLVWISRTASNHRKALTSITLAASLTLTAGAKPSPQGRYNSPKDFDLLAKYASNLSIPVVILDPITQLIHYTNFSTYLPYFGYNITLFFPPSVTRIHYYHALDRLTTFAFALRGQQDGQYGYAVVNNVKSRHEGRLAHHWAKSCIDPTSYNLASTSPPNEANLLQAIVLADCPWSPFTSFPDVTPLPSFTRIPLSPSAADAAQELYIAAPIKFDFKNDTYRAASQTPFRVMVPRPGVDLVKATASLQTTMAKLLRRVQEVKQTPLQVGAEEIELWIDAVNGISWALGKECMERMPKDWREKVALFGKSLVLTGTWGVCVEKTRNARKDDSVDNTAWGGGQAK